MAFETELGNLTTIGNDISALMAPAFKESTVMLNLVTVEQFPDNTKVIKARKSGSLTAAALSESTAYTYSASSELTDTSVTITAAKVAVNTKVTKEALRFGAGQANFERVAAEQGRALARKFDLDATALFGSLSQAETATNVLIRDELLDAMQLIQAGNTPMDGVPLVFVGHAKQIGDIRKDLSNDAATPWSNLALLDILTGSPQPNGFVGNYAGIDCYISNLVAADSTDYTGAVFHPVWCFFAGVGGAFETNVDYDVDSYLYKIGSHMFYDVKEWNDAAGVGIVSDI